MDLINESDAPANCSVKLILLRADPATQALREVRRTESHKILLPPNARVGLRVVEPLIPGSCCVEYEVSVNGEPLASGRFEFDSVGPYRVAVQSYWLAKEAALVHVEPLTPAALAAAKTGQVRFKLLDATGGKVLFETKPAAWDRVRGSDENEPPQIFARDLISLKGQPPGNYRILVEILNLQEGRQITANLVLPFIVP